MADNTTLPGTGDVIAADDVGGVKYQIIKLAIGNDGSASMVGTSQPLPVGGVRQDADVPPVVDGALHPLLFNSTGRLKVSVMPADQAMVTGTITAVGGVVSYDCARVSNISASMVAVTLVGHNVIFEVSNTSTDGANGQWYTVQALRSNANTVETVSGVLTSTPVYMWLINVAAYSWLRIRATAHTSGSAIYTISPSAFVSEPIPAAQISGTQPVSGSVAVSGTVTATVTGGTTLPVTPTTTFTNSAATTNAAVIKNSAGTLWSITANNTNAAARFLKLYNLTVAPTVGTSVPVLTIPIPPGAVISITGGSNGLRFGTGISMAITGAAADADTTVVAASEIKVATTFT